MSPGTTNKLRKPRSLEYYLLKNRIITEKGCWVNPDDSDKYGKMQYRHMRKRYHQWSAHLYLNYIFDNDLQVNHKPECNNPHCFNPEHLYIGTQKENVQDAGNLGNMKRKYIHKPRLKVG